MSEYKKNAHFLEMTDQQVEILLWAVKIFMMTGGDCVINIRDFHSGRSSFNYERSSFSW